MTKYSSINIYRSLTQSEILTKNAAKIDFSKNANEEVSQAKKEDEKKEDDEILQSQWPFDSIRNKLKDAYTEVTVLYDVLSIAKDKRYMVCDPVPKEIQETKQMAQVYARKKALANAAGILISGAERLKGLQSDQRHGKNGQDFHIELLRLRQNWRLKKVANTIIGLCY